MDFERDWDSKDTADHQQALHPEAAALSAKGKAVHPGKMHHHHADVVRTVAPNPDGTVVLPAGTDINQIEVSGRNLIVHLPDGTDMVILDGAVVMPRLVVGDVEIPSVNLAALLIGEEPKPAAGPPRSSGGNFIGPDGNVGDPHGLGDLLPPTELQFNQHEEREILPIAPNEQPEVTIITPNQPAGATAATAGVSEAGLGPRGSEPAGSAAASDSERTTGTIAITANDGLAGVTINGTAITTVGQTIATPLGVLTITSIAEDAIGYSYVLSDNVVGTPPAEVLTVVVTDTDGDQASATLTISIADDAPSAVNDVDSVTEDGPLVADGNVLTGSGGSDANTTDGIADVQGADGAVVSTTGTFQGSYGVLTLNAAGAYTYTLANDNAAVQFLLPGQTVTDSFSYTITDADGDTSTATLTITINGADDGITITGLNGAPGVEGAEVVVQENDLADGSSPDAAALTRTGSFSVSGADGLSSVTVGGVSVLSNGAFVTGQVVTTPLGTLTITGFTPTSQQAGSPTAGTFTYSFVLTDNSLAHDAAGADSILQSFAVVATDRNGSTANATVDVQIVDDLPVANNDVDTVAAGTYGPETGNVITGAGTTSGAAGADVKGADGAVVSTTGTFEGSYGTLTLNADGSYSYVRAAGTPGGVSDSFSYTLRDGDGDTSTATLRIDIADSNVMIISIPRVGEGTVVDEAGLNNPVGSDAASDIETTDGTIIYAAPDGPATVTINGIPITGAGQEIVTEKGILTITGLSEGSIDYSYTLTTNTTGDTVTDSFEVTVTDVDGDKATDTLTITIVDDVPTAVNDVDSVHEDGPLVADGNVITGSGGTDANSTDGAADVQGADGAHVTAIAFGEIAGTVGTPLAGLYGSLLIQADGSYAYTLNNENGVVQGLDKNQTLTETFTYTLTDGDGDTSSATVTITVQGNDDGVTINGLDGEGAEETLFENDLPGGSSENAAALTQTGSFTLSAPDGVATVTVGGQAIFGASGFISGVTLSNAYGTLSITGFTPTVGADGDVIGGTVSYSYVLNDNTLLHTGANDFSLTDSFAVVVTDTDGSTDSASLDITVVDDVPAAANDSATQGSENAAVTIDVFANDIAGADGVNLASGVVLETGAAKGSVVYQGNGVFLYTPAPGAEGSDSFTYTITDGDGDKSTATVTITLLQDSTPTVTVTDMTVSEAGLPGGTQSAGDSETASGSMTIATGGDTLTKVEVQDKNGAWIDVTAATAGTPVIVAGAAGALTVTSDGAGHYSYSYTLAVNDPTHPDTITSDGDGISGAADPKAGDAFAVRVTDSDGDVSPADAIHVTVLDDAPIAAPDSGSVDEGSALIVTAANGVLANDQAGADGFAPGVVGVAKGSDAGTPVSGQVGTAVDGDYGKLTLFADGSYRYDATPNAISSDKQDVFVYTIRDADGDLATTTLTINVANVALAADNQTKTVYEAALDTSVTGSDIAAGSVTGSTPGEPTETATGQLSVVGAVSYTLTSPALGGHGQIQLNNDGSYTYTLTSPVDGPDANDGPLTVAGAEVFTYQAVDGSGNIANGTITIDVVDDIPTAVDDTARTVAEDGADISGNVMTNDTPGADGATLTSVTIGGVTTAINAVGTTPVTTTFGAYTFTAAGAWTFNPSTNLNNASGVSAGFSYVITDGDGDQATALQPITVTDGAGPSAGEPISLTLDDQNLAGGTSAANPDSASGSITFTPGSDAITSIIFGDTAGLSAGLTWDRLSDTKITGSDERGVVVTLNLSVVGTVATVTATLNDNYDTHPVVNVDDLVALGSVQVIATDTDGDTATGSVSISVSDDLPVVSANPTVQLDDDALGGNANGTGDDANSVNATGTLGHDYRADGAGGITLLGTGAPTGFSYESNGTVLLVKQGSTTVLTVTLTDPVAGTYSVVQNAAIVHPLGNNENNVSFDIGYRVTDADNDTANGTLTINVDDDTPVAAGDTDIVKEDVTLSASGNVLTGVGSDGNVAGADSLGADGPAAGGAVTVVTGGSIGGTAAGTYGSLVLNATGGYTYTLNNALPAVQHLDDGQTLTDSFTYTITDGDGDSTTAVLTITIQGTNDAPQVGSGIAIVSEEGLTGGNLDGSGSPSDTTNATVANGTITATDVDGDSISMTLGNPGAVLTADGLPVTWSGVGTQALIGSVGAVQVITVSITNAGAYTVTLLQSVDHSGINVEDLKNFSVPVNVSDGTVTVGTSISVTIEDDSPIAVDDNITTTEKALASTGNVLGNDHVGADTPGAVVSINGTLIAAGGSQTIVAAFGTLQIFSDGTYNYTPKTSVPSGSFDSFTYVMRDADNDTASATLKFTFEGDQNKPTADNTAAKLDDDGLTGGNPLSTTGDVDANVGDSGAAGPSEASFSGTLPFTFGADGGGSVTFSNLNGTTGTVGTDSVSYSWNGSTNTLTATITTVGGRVGTALFQVVVNPTSGAYTLTLLDNVLHAAGGNENDTSVSLNFLVTDSDYNITTNPTSSAIGQLNISFNDDMPTATAPLAVSLINQAGGTNSAFLDSDHDVDNNYGADGGQLLFTAASITALQSQALTSGLQALSYAISADGLTLTATKPDASAVFTVQLQPAGFADKYVVTMAQPLDAVTNVDFNNGGYNFVGGNGAWAGFNTAANDDSKDLLLTPMTNGVDGGTMNTNANEGGVSGGNSVGSGEAVRVDFVRDLTGSPASGQDYGVLANQTHAFEAHYNANGASALFTSTSNSTVRVITRDDVDTDNDVGDGVQDNITGVAISYSGVTTQITSGGTYVVGGHSFTVTFSGGQAIIAGVADNTRIAAFTPSGYNSIEFHYESGQTFKIGDFGAAIQTTNPVNFTIPISIVDGDGDTASGGTLAVTATAPVAPPVALDLDGDGLEFVGLSAGISHDYGNGAVNTAWVAADDGLLAHAVGGSLDIVFSDDAVGATSDLEGLRLAYDSNGDGVFDAQDAKFSEFGVWQDANANGVVDAGEFKSLADAGIKAIELTADGKSYTAANGDVTVLGEASFVRTDGSKGTIGDVLFTTAAKESEASKAESTASGFNQALVAASLVAVAGAAETTAEQPPAPATTESAAPVTESAPAAATTTEPAATQESPSTSLASADDHGAHDQPAEQSSHGGEEPAPDHATLSDGGNAPAPAAVAEAPQPDLCDPPGLLAQSINLPPAFDGNAAAALAAAKAPANAATAAAEVVKEALGAHDVPHIDALLAALPGGEHVAAPMLLNPIAGEPVDSGHMAALAAGVFEAAMAAHEAMAVAHA